MNRKLISFEHQPGMSHYTRAVGIDIRSQRVEIACAETRWGRLRYLETEVLPVSPRDPDAASALEDLLNRNGWSGLPCLVSTHGESTVMRSLSCRSRRAHDIRRRVDRELSQFSGLPEASRVSSYDLMQGVSGQPRIVLALTRNEVVEEAGDLPGRLGLQLVGVVPGAVALYNALCGLLPDSEQPVILLDAGELVTELVIASPDELMFARSFTARPDTNGDEVARDWLHELVGCLDHYLAETTLPDQRPERMYLSGGGATPALAGAVSKRLGIEVQPVRVLSSDPSWEGVLEQPVAAGLAMAGVNEAPLRVSLLPRTQQEKICLRWHLRYWSVLCATWLIMLLTMWAMMRWSTARKQSVLDTKQYEWQQIERYERELGEVEQAGDRLRRQIAPLKTAVHNGEITRALLAALARSKHADDWIILVADAHSYAGAESAGPEGRGLAVEQVVIEGYTPVDDLSTVYAMIEALRGDAAVLDADLLGDDRLRESGERDTRWKHFRGRLFAVEISVPPA